MAKLCWIILLYNTSLLLLYSYDGQELNIFIHIFLHVLTKTGRYGWLQRLTGLRTVEGNHFVVLINQYLVATQGWTAAESLEPVFQDNYAVRPSSFDHYVIIVLEWFESLLYDPKRQDHGQGSCFL